MCTQMCTYFSQYNTYRYVYTCFSHTHMYIYIYIHIYIYTYVYTYMYIHFGRALQVRDNHAQKKQLPAEFRPGPHSLAERLSKPPAACKWRSLTLPSGSGLRQRHLHLCVYVDNMVTCTYIHTYSSVCICIYVCMYVYIYVYIVVDIICIYLWIQHAYTFINLQARTPFRVCLFFIGWGLGLLRRLEFCPEGG